MSNNTNLIFLIGPAGSGKSTVGKLLAQKLHYCYLDKDMLANQFTGAMLIDKGFEPTQRDDCEYYKDVIYSLEYNSLLAVACDNLNLGNSVILDAPFIGYFNQKDYVTNYLTQNNLSYVNAIVLKVSVNSQTLKTRIMSRNNERDAWKLKNWDTFLNSLKAKVCQWDGIKYIEFDNSNENIDEDLLLSYFK